jgi:uncharacterized damage-inducible protein DinB
MSSNEQFVATIYEGWRAYQAALIEALAPLTEEQLAVHVGPALRSVENIARHMIGARARWFYMLMQEGGEAFKEMGRWDHPDGSARSAAELVQGLEGTWAGMQAAIQRWTEEDWQQTWPGEDDTEPEIITRQWVIWHLIEHDVHHGGEISMILGAHDMDGLAL